MALYTSLVDIWTSRPDLQKAFPKGTVAGTSDNTSLNNWWNQYGVKEYPGVTLVPPGDSRIQKPTTLTAEAQVKTVTTPEVEISALPVIDTSKETYTGPGTPDYNKTQIENGKLMIWVSQTGATGYDQSRWVELRDATPAEIAATATGTEGQTKVIDGKTYVFTPEGEWVITGGEKTKTGGWTEKEYTDIYKEFGFDITPAELQHHLTNQTSLTDLRNWLTEKQPELMGARIPRTDVPDFRTLTDAERAEFMASAEEELTPYYTEKGVIAKRTVADVLSEIGTEKRIAGERSARNLNQALDESSAAMAARGLAFSGIREKEAGQLEIKQAESLLDVLRPLISKEQGAYRTLEEAIGSSAMRQLYPEYGISTEITGNIPYERGFESSRYGLEKIAGEREARSSDWMQQILSGYGV